jgi:FKBP-type peptidyl-prolyl cis-trans isomerase FkpA
MRYIFPLLILIFCFSSCGKKKAKEQAATDEAIILAYISDHNLTASATGSGLYYVINTPGTGASCTSNSQVRVAYRGYLTNGEVFDESPAAGIEFGLSGVIKGWTEGIPYFKEGGDGILLIPSALGYGTSGTSGIPPNTVLIFDVELIDVL